MKKKKLISFLFTTITAGLLFTCSKEGVPENFFAKGADVGWITEMEAKGIKFHYRTGAERDVLQILKDNGINAVRLRAWVNPKAGWNNTKDVIVKAKRAQALGMKIMIDFHYADDWADPGKQPKPAAWAKLNAEDLVKAVYNYTVYTMDSLKVAGIVPEWVQVGNETNDGMLWETGRASTGMKTWSKLVDAGYRGIKTASPSSKVIVHLSNAYDNKMFRWMFDSLKANGVKWDIIGMSVYPHWSPTGDSSWRTINNQALANMNDMVARYGTPVMAVEVGMPANDPVTSKLFLSDIIAKTRSVANNMGKGVFYWEPECFDSYNGYTLGCFDENHAPTTAMDAFLD